MARMHLFEFNDQPWLPDVLRDAETGYLETISRRFKMHEPMTEVIADVLERSGEDRFDPESVHTRILESYESLIASHRGK